MLYVHTDTPLAAFFIRETNQEFAELHCLAFAKLDGIAGHRVDLQMDPTIDPDTDITARHFEDFNLWSIGIHKVYFLRLASKRRRLNNLSGTLPYAGKR